MLPVALASTARVALVTLTLAAAILPWSATPTLAQESLLLTDSLTLATPPPPPFPFQPGEKLRYKVKYGILSIGEAHMTVAPQIDTIQGFPTYAASWHIKGGVLGYGIDSKFHTWIDTEKIVSRRFVKDQHEGGRKRYREFNFFPEEQHWQRIDYDSTGALPTDAPLDDVSFVYFARTLPLEVGQTYTFDRFYKDEGNPVVLEVLRKDRRKVGAGEFNTIVVRPIIKTSGLFSEGGEAEIHFSDNDQRLIVYMKIDMLAFNLTFHLEEAVEGGQAGAEDGPVSGDDGGNS